MSIHPRSFAVGAFLLHGACFSPGGQLTDTTGEPSTEATATAGTSTSTDATTTPTTSDSTTTPTTTTDSTTGGCGTCMSPTPYCVPTGECVGCEQLPDHAMSCGLLDPATPLCDQVGAVGSGQCVACLSSVDCDQDNQICDPANHTCIGPPPACERHDDCKSGACELDTGTCFPDDARRLFVNIGSACAAGECTVDMPCCEISEAFAAIADAGVGAKYNIVQVAPGTYSDQLLLTRDQTQVAVLGQGKVVLDVSTPDNTSIVMIGDAVTKPTPHLESKLFLSKLVITGSGSVGASCFDAAFLGIDEVTMTDVMGGSLLNAACESWVRRSQFRRNSAGLWLLGSGQVRIENSIIAGAQSAPALRVSPETQLDILYSTVTSQNGDQLGGLLTCVDPGVMPPPKVNIRNSAMLAGGPMSVTCIANITTANSAISDPALDMGPPAGNLLVTMDMVVLPFIDWGNSDLHLIGDGAFLKNLARWQTGDPATDIDGLPRPAMDAAPDVAGADLPGP
jgi:hypothetical protein